MTIIFQAIIEQIYDSIYQTLSDWTNYSGTTEYYDFLITPAPNTDNMGKLFVTVFAFTPAPKTNS
jgi:hypothetical protein